MDDDQQFCLRWNNHQSTLISVFDTLLENGTLVDCTLAAEGQFLKAHKVVLSACSPYFASLLSQQYDKHPIFILKDVKFQELRAMMDYMYRGEVNISQDQLAALLKAAESLQIKGLSDSRGGNSSTNAGSGQKSEHNKPLSVPVSTTGKASGISSGYTLEQKRPRHAMGALSIDTQELAGSREGSSSPTSRKRKKIRRRSLDNIMADNHEHSNSSSHSMQINSSTAPSNTSAAAATAVAPSTSSSTSTTSAALLVSGAATGLNVTKKTDNIKDTNVEQDMENDGDDDHTDQHQENNKNIHMKKEQNHKRKSQVVDTDNKDNDMLIEPKSEYDDGNDETVEDLTLDEEELLEDLEQAGPSHGGEGSSQGYAQWQVDRSQDEVFLAAQEAAGQQRDPQGDNDKGPSFARIRVRNWLMMTEQGKNLGDEEQNTATSPSPGIDEGGNNLEDEDNTSDNANGGVVIKCERHSPSPSLYNNSQHSNQSADFNYDLKISSPISWAFEPIKAEKSHSEAATTIYTAVKKTLKSSNLIKTKPLNSKQEQENNHGNEKKYRILFQNQRIRKESLEHSEDMIYNGEYEKPWICRNCNRNYKWKNSLKCHLKNECGQPPRFFCSKMCGYRTNVHSNLKRHLNTKCRTREDESSTKSEKF